MRFQLNQYSKQIHAARPAAPSQDATGAFELPYHIHGADVGFRTRRAHGYAFFLFSVLALAWLLQALVCFY